MNALNTLWHLLRHLADENAYENYRAHQLAYHPEKIILNKKQFYRQLQHNKWQKTQRCC